MTGACDVGAFFDLDGTLVPAPSLERRFVRYLLLRRVIGVAALVRWIAGVLEDAPIGAPFAEADRDYLAGLSCSLAEEWLADRGAPLPFFVEGLRELEAHVACGHGVFIVSGTLAPLARAVANRLPGRVLVCATELKTAEISSGDSMTNNSGAPIWSGRLAGEWVNGAAKGRAVHQLATQFGLDLSRSYAYGDSAGDIPMLAAVAKPRAVNPSFGLRRVARARRWTIERWRQEISARGVPAARLATAFSEVER